MPSFPKLGLISILLLVLVPQFSILGAQDILTIGWAELETASIEDDMSRLGVLLPRALMKATSFITERYMSQGEVSVRSLKTVSLDLEKAKDAVATARRKRDLVSITTRDLAKRATELQIAQATLDKSIAALDTLIQIQADIPFQAAPPAAALKLWNGHAEGKLLPPTEAASVICAENKLDILVYGKIETIGPYLTIELVLFIATTDDMAWKTVEYAAFDDLDGLVATLERPLATALAGRPFGRAIFNIDPEKSEILVDGIVYAGNHPLFYNQGSFIATISAAGYRTASTRFAIVPGSDTFVKVRLEPVQSSPVFVESFPSGAVLYIDGAPLGTTPLQLSGAAYPRVLTTRMNGFDDLRVVVRPGPESERMVLDLQASDGLGYAERFKLAKGAFYQSLGWFIVSLPVTVLSYGTLNSYQSLLGSITLTDWSRMEDSLTLRFYGSQTVFWMSTAVSMGLATNSIVRLVRYIKAAR